MVKGKTSSGYKYSFDESVCQDWRYVKALKNVRKGAKDPEAFLDGATALVEVLFNDHDAEEAYYQFLAEKYGGRVPSEVVFSEVNEIITELTKQSGKTAKN
jgi:hypothetical protein